MLKKRSRKMVIRGYQPPIPKPGLRGGSFCKLASQIPKAITGYTCISPLSCSFIFTGRWEGYFTAFWGWEQSFMCRMTFQCTLLSSLGEGIKVGLHYPTGGLQHSHGQDCDKEEWPSWSEPKWCLCCWTSMLTTVTVDNDHHVQV